MSLEACGVCLAFGLWFLGRGRKGSPHNTKGLALKASFLGAPLTLFPNTLDKLKLVELVFGDAESRQNLASWSERHTRRARAVIGCTWSGHHNKQGLAPMELDTRPLTAGDVEFRDRTENVLKSDQIEGKGVNLRARADTPNERKTKKRREILK